MALIDEWNNELNVEHFPYNYMTYIESNTNLLYSDFYLLFCAVLEEDGRGDTNTIIMGLE